MAEKNASFGIGKPLTDVALLFDAYRQFYQQAPDLALATRFIRERMSGNKSVILLAENSAL